MCKSEPTEWKKLAVAVVEAEQIDLADLIAPFEGPEDGRASSSPNS